jgi:acetyl esterase
MALQPDVAAFLGMLAQSSAAPGAVSTANKPVADARRDYVAMFKMLGADPPGDDVVSSAELNVPGKEGPDVHCVAYKPVNLIAGGVQPVIQYMHGGGWTLGSTEAYDGFCRQLSALTGCVVLSVDYRLGPEAPSPAASIDCYRVFEWLTAPGASFFGIRVDTHGIILSGDSAGGNLTCVVSLMARNAGLADRILLQVSKLLVCCTTHSLLTCACSTQMPLCPSTNLRDMNTASHKAYATDHFLTQESMVYFRQNFTRNDPAILESMAASPLLATDFSGLPPAAILTASHDPLVDEGAAYAKRLIDEGVPTLYKCFPGQIHVFWLFGKALKDAAPAVQYIATTMRAALETRPAAAKCRL